MLSLAAVLFAMVGLVGCKGNEGKIVGKWWVVADSEDGENWNEQVKNEKVVWIIEKNGKWTKYEHFNTDYVDFDGTTDWNLDGDKLKLGDEEMTIKNLTDNEMMVKAEWGYAKLKKME